jgi:hypothetical protein
MSDTVQAIRALDESLRATLKGLNVLCDSLEVQTEMQRRILTTVEEIHAVVTAPADASELSALLQRLTTAVEANTTAVAGMAQVVARLAPEA